jgi:ABC-2 type transport system permease protein
MTGAAAILYRDYRQRMTNVSLVFWDLLAPVAYLALFGTGFDRMMGTTFASAGQPFGYVAFLLPGVLAMVTFGVAMNTSWGFFTDKDSGIVYEMLTYPITRHDILLGKIGFNLLLAFVGVALVLALAVVAYGTPLAWWSLPPIVIVTVVSTAGWFSIFTGLAITLDRMDTFNAVASAMYLLLMFFSSMFYPLSDLPGWFRIASYLNPLTWQVDLLRFGTLGLGRGPGLLVEAVALVVFTVACLAFAVRSLNRVS